MLADLIGMETLTTIRDSDVSGFFRFNRWRYAALNGTHILGIALLVGAVVPLNLRLLGFWRAQPFEPAVRMLSPMAATGLALALTTGALLFTVRATGYATLDIFALKLALIATGTLAALWAHARHGLWLDRLGRGRARAHAALSLVCWVAALGSGRLIAYSGM